MLTLNDGRSELWQWDTGRTLAVDADCSQVHFSNKVFGRSIDVDVADGVAIIPDVLLQTDKDLNVWAFVGTAENGYTKISKTFKVNRRNKPADYVFTPPDQTSIEEIKEKIDYLESIQDPDAIKNAVEDYLEQNQVVTAALQSKADAESLNSWAFRELFSPEDLGDPENRNSIIEIDGVEYYRYHASGNNFTWTNPRPRVGSVTITARGVSQYGGTGNARLLTFYDDGTSGPYLVVVANGEPQTVTVTTEAGKTLAKITGNYDLENWVLLDLSVMSVKQDADAALPFASADAAGGIKADPVESTDTQPVRIGADGKLYTAPGASGGGETPVSGGDLELIATVTTTEEVTVIEIDMDSNGKQFALKDIGINLDRTYTNPGSTGLIIESTGVNGRKYRLAYIPNMIKVTQYIRKFYSDSFVVSMFSSAADSVSEDVWTGYTCPSNNNISKIKLNLSKTDISFPVGTKIELWGVRA